MQPYANTATWYMMPVSNCTTRKMGRHSAPTRMMFSTHGISDPPINRSSPQVPSQSYRRHAAVSCVGLEPNCVTHKQAPAYTLAIYTPASTPWQLLAATGFNMLDIYQRNGKGLSGGSGFAAVSESYPSHSEAVATGQNV